MRSKHFVSHAFIILLILVFLYPFIYMVSSSFKSLNEIFSCGLKILPETVTMENYSPRWMLNSIC